MPLEFSFNQQELEKMANNPATKKIVISICNVPEPDGVSELYLCAQPFGKDNLRITSQPVAAGCPNPPGWQNVPQSLINKRALKNAPAYAIAPAKLKAILKMNSFVQDNIAKILVELGGKTVKKVSRETGKKVNSFESVILFKPRRKGPDHSSRPTSRQMEATAF